MSFELGRRSINRMVCFSKYGAQNRRSMAATGRKRVATGKEEIKAVNFRIMGTNVRASDSNAKGSSSPSVGGLFVEQARNSFWFSAASFFALVAASALGISFYKLLWPSSSVKLRSRVIKRLNQSSKARQLLGSGPIRAFGDDTNVRAHEFQKEGVFYVQLVFRVQGSARAGTVYALLQSSGGLSFALQELVLDVDSLKTRAIIDVGPIDHQS